MDTGTGVRPTARSGASSGAHALATPGARPGHCASSGASSSAHPTAGVRASSSTRARATRGGRPDGAPARIAAARAGDELIDARGAKPCACDHGGAPGTPQRDDDKLRCARGAERGLRDLVLGQAAGASRIPVLHILARGRRAPSKLQRGQLTDDVPRCACAGRS